MNEFKKYWTRSKQFEHGRNIFEPVDGIGISSYYVPLYWKLSLYLEYFVEFKMISWRLLKLLWNYFLLPGSFIPFFVHCIFVRNVYVGPTGFPRRNSPCVHDDLENHKNEEFHFILILLEVSNLKVFIFEVQLQGP